MSYQEPAASGYELTASEIDPAHHAIVPSDDQQDLAFRSIRAIDPKALLPQGAATIAPERRTPKGIRPMIWVRLNETKSAVLFEVTLHTGQCVQVHVPFDSWRLGTSDPEAVRAAIQKAYCESATTRPFRQCTMTDISAPLSSSSEPLTAQARPSHCQTGHDLTQGLVESRPSSLHPSNTPELPRLVFDPDLSRFSPIQFTSSSPYPSSLAPSRHHRTRTLAFARIAHASPLAFASSTRATPDPSDPTSTSRTTQRVETVEYDKLVGQSGRQSIAA
ncbi:hypothetical protein FRC16_005897, partial [Serendipita sp. 398]